MPVAIVVNERAACVPADFGSRLVQARFVGYVRESSIAVIRVKRVLPVVGDEQVVVAVVVVIADAAGLAPSRAMLQPRPFGHIRKGAVAIVLEQMAARFLPSGEALQPPA